MRTRRSAASASAYRAGQAPQLVVGRANAVERDPDAAQSGGGGAGDALLAEVAAAGLQVAAHPGGADRGNDLQPILPQIGLAADQAHIACAELCDLIDEVECLRGGELVAPAAAGAGAAMAAGKVAGERDLPDHAHRNAVQDIVEPRVADGQGVGALRLHLLGLLGGRLELLDKAVNIAILGLDVARSLNQRLDLDELTALEDIVDSHAIEDATWIKQLESLSSVSTCLPMVCHDSSPRVKCLSSNWGEEDVITVVGGCQGKMHENINRNKSVTKILHGWA